jgi:hypothetical protein
MRYVRPPKGCAIVLIERPLTKPSDPNWVATVSPIGLEYSKRYTEKVACIRGSLRNEGAGTR